MFIYNLLCCEHFNLLYTYFNAISTAIYTICFFFLYRESAMEVKDKENSSHQSARDLDTNRKQLNQLKKTNDNLLAENQ